MKIFLIILFLCSCTGEQREIANFNTQDIDKIKEISNKNEGLDYLLIKYKNNYKMVFNNKNEMLVGKSYCHSINEEECIKVTMKDFDWCIDLCKNNEGLNKLETVSNGDRYVYLGVLGGYFMEYHQQYTCSCNNQIFQTKTNIIQNNKYR